MTEQQSPKQVGSPDPEKRNSPIAEDTDELATDLRQIEPGGPACYFNGETFSNGDYVCSGNELLRCGDGIWERAGSCDPDNS